MSCVMSIILYMRPEANLSLVHSFSELYLVKLFGEYYKIGDDSFSSGFSVWLKTHAFSSPLKIKSEEEKFFWYVRRLFVYLELFIFHPRITVLYFLVQDSPDSFRLDLDSIHYLLSSWVLTNDLLLERWSQLVGRLVQDGICFHRSFFEIGDTQQPWISPLSCYVYQLIIFSYQNLQGKFSKYQWLIVIVDCKVYLKTNARWLWRQGRKKEAIEVLRWMARINQRSIDGKMLASLEQQDRLLIYQINKIDNKFANS